MEKIEPKPDAGRLLTEEEQVAVYNRSMDPLQHWHRNKFRDETMCKEQFAKDQKFEQARVKRIFKEIDDLINVYTFGDGSFMRFEDCWLALKKREGIDSRRK